MSAADEGEEYSSNDRHVLRQLNCDVVFIQFCSPHSLCPDLVRNSLSPYYCAVPPNAAAFSTVKHYYRINP